jgi:short subunit dehydrogenase
MNELDFGGKTVLVVGGSSGIGNGIAQAFRAHGAAVHVCGTRAKASDYHKEEGSDLGGLHYSQLDVSSSQAIEAARFPFERLDVLVQSQGAVLYKREEFKMDGFRKVIESRRCRSGPHTGAGVGRRWHSRQWHRTRARRYQDDEGHDGQSTAPRGCTRNHSDEAAGHAH